MSISPKTSHHTITSIIKERMCGIGNHITQNLERPPTNKSSLPADIYPHMELLCIIIIILYSYYAHFIFRITAKNIISVPEFFVLVNKNKIILIVINVHTGCVNRKDFKHLWGSVCMHVHSVSTVL